MKMGNNFQKCVVLNIERRRFFPPRVSYKVVILRERKNRSIEHLFQIVSNAHNYENSAWYSSVDGQELLTEELVQLNPVTTDPLILL
ncbi:hypothetical protein TNIN_355611 [Trichonephila inaurata madagascariensis]|uniref:Uncharacterized protein n=1 Tax=Trichonephila inaurata madagascariensis TaxID=2747483 RepID=A0A8X7BWY3_9ARAC|nr:hypothetical protein TNIN_355611 [Trichonephila inaurata madagascariensis]